MTEFHRLSLVHFLSAALLLATGTVVTMAGPAQAQQQAAAGAPSDELTADAPALLTDDELEVLVARIALYPDELVALVSSASLFPLQIVEAQRFLDNKKKVTDLKPKDSWDDSVISLLNYPEIVKMMSDELDWTQSLGSALAYQQKDVLMAIQALRDKAVADGVIKTDDKVKVVNEGDNVVIQAANPEQIYIPKYEPEMLYEPGYAPAPITYYAESYPSYYYPTAPYFAAAIVGGAIWAAAVDWDDWGVWGGNWGGDVDIDCDNCFNDIDIDRDKFKMNDVDWKNVDRSKITFDKDQFANIDRDKFKNEFKADRSNNVANRAKDVRRSGGDKIDNRPGKVSVDDIRKSKVDADRARQRAGNVDRGKAGQVAGDKRAGGASAGKDSNAKTKNANRKVSKPKPGGQVQKRPDNRPSAMGNVSSKRQTQSSSQRGRQSMSGGGHRRPQASRGGGGGVGHARPPRGGGGRR